MVFLASRSPPCSIMRSARCGQNAFAVIFSFFFRLRFSRRQLFRQQNVHALFEKSGVGRPSRNTRTFARGIRFLPPARAPPLAYALAGIDAAGDQLPQKRAAWRARYSHQQNLAARQHRGAPPRIRDG